MTDSKTWPKCIFFNVLFFFWAADVSNLSRSQLCSVWIWNLIFGWTRYKTEHRVEEVCCSKCFIVSVMSFHLYFDKQVHKKLKKKQKQKQKKLSKPKKIKSLNFAESNAHQKTNARGRFETNNFFFCLRLNLLQKE